MEANVVVGFIIVFLVFYFVVMLATSFLRGIVFIFEPLFSFINYLQWIIHNPLRFLWKNKTGFSRGSFLIFAFTGINIAWFCIAYFLTFPFRLVTGIYYDIILYNAVSIADNIQEFLNPKKGKMRYRKGFSYLFFYILGIPYRFVLLVFNGFFYIFDSILMFGVSLALPTLTMFHGTSFRDSSTKIVQSKNWYVGHGNYAGTGIYFGVSKRVARNYAPDGDDHSIILCRVTLSFCRTIATMTKADRDLVGFVDGDELSRRVAKGLCASVEHWRDDGNWWEYCIVKPNKRGEFITSWRIRPVALINKDWIARTYGGFGHYCLGSGLIAGILSWFIVFFWLVFFLAEP